MIVLLFVSLIILIAALLLEHLDELNDEKKREKERIEYIQSYVTSAFDDLLEEAERFGEDYYTSLNDFANKMDKLLAKDIKDDLRPYDIYNVKRLSDDIRSSDLGRIVIDKNLIPRFMLTAPSLERGKCDIELMVAYDSSRVRELADKCRKIKMGVDIEKFRKNKVKDIINGN